MYHHNPFIKTAGEAAVGLGSSVVLWGHALADQAADPANLAAITAALAAIGTFCFGAASLLKLCLDVYDKVKNGGPVPTPPLVPVAPKPQRGDDAPRY